MKTIRHALILILALSMLLALISGCAGKTEAPAEESAAPSQEAPATQETVQPEESVQPEEPAEPQITRVDYELPLYDEPQSFSFWCTTKGMGESRAEDYTFWAQLADATNIDIEFVECGEDIGTEKYNIMIASGQLTDLVYEEGPTYPGGNEKALADGVYMDLTDTVKNDMPNYYSKILEVGALADLTSDEGHIVYIASLTDGKAANTQGDWIRADALEQTGMEMPDTVEGMYDLWCAMADLGIYETPVRLAFGGGLPSGIAAAMGTSGSSSFLVSTADGKVVYDATSDNFRKFQEFFINCYNEGVLNQEFYNQATDMTDVFAGVLGVFTSNLSFITNQYSGPEVVPMPRVHLEDNDSVLLTSTTSTVRKKANCSAVWAETEKLDVIVKWTEFVFSDEGIDICNFGFDEGVSYQVVDGKKQLLPEMMNRNEDNLLGWQVHTMYEGPGFFFCDNELNMMTDDAKEIVALWDNYNDDGAIYTTMPDYIEFTEAEGDEVNTLLADIETYVETTTLAWETGEAPLNDETWAEYVATIEGFGLDTIIGHYQDAYDRYLAR